MSFLEELIVSFIDEVVMSDPKVQEKTVKLRKKTNEIVKSYNDKKNRMITNYERAQERTEHMSDEEICRAIKCTNDNAAKSGYLNALNNRRSEKNTKKY